MAGFNNDIVVAQTGMRIGDTTISSSEQASVQFSDPGADVALLIRNTSNSANSRAFQKIQSENADCWTQWTIGVGRTWALGIDQSDSNNLRLTSIASGSSDPSTGTPYIIASSNPAASPPGILFPLQIVHVNTSAVGGQVQFEVKNDDQSNPASDAIISARVGLNAGATSGNPFLSLAIENITEVGFALDNADEDALKMMIGAGSADAIVEANIFEEVTQEGEVTFPLTPCFLAFLSATANNVTGAGSLYNIVYNAEIFDQNSDFSTATGVFTAPITGRYSFQFGAQVQGLGPLNTNSIFRIQTSNRRILTSSLDIGGPRSSLNAYVMNGSCIIEMDAADIAFITVIVFNGAANTVDIGGEATGLFMITFFSGKLEA